MKLINRFIYLIYYLKKTDIKQFNKYLCYSAKISEKSRIRLITHAIISVFKYNTSLSDYFIFGFYLLDKSECLEWAGTGFMYEYQLKMNPKSVRMVLEDKIRFLNKFERFLNRQYSDLQTLKPDHGLLESFLSNNSGKLVLKGSKGQVGAEVEVISCSDFSPGTLIDYMVESKFDMIEEYVVQHSSLMSLSPSGLNTVRIFTQLHNGDVDFLGARLRITVNSPVDNMAAGNLAAPVDMESGIVNGPGVFSDITSEDKETHPVTGKQIVGFEVPYWNEVVELAREAACNTPENRSVGWDIAITDVGPELIEGNHNWCKILWQLPVKRGLKKTLEKYL